MDRKTFLRWGGALAAAQVTAGCAQKSILRSSSRPLMEPGEGMVLASMGYRTVQDGKWAQMADDEPDLSLRVDAIPERTGGWLELNVQWGEPRLIVRTREQVRVVLAYSLPPGRYKLGVRKMALAGRYGGHSVELLPRRTATFDIKAGDITYIGYHEFDYSVVRGRPQTARVRSADVLFDDLAQLHALRPEAKGLAVHDGFFQGLDV